MLSRLPPRPARHPPPKTKTLPEAITYRTATPIDAAGIAPLSGQLGYPATPADILNRLEMLRTLGSHQIFVAVTGCGKIAGWAHVARVRHLMEPDFAELIGLVVDDDQRSRRIGSQLLELAESWALENGLSCMWVRSNVIRLDAHRFYLAHGYSILKDQRLFVKDLPTYNKNLPAPPEAAE